MVALKKILMENEKEGFPITALREVKMLQQLKHENITELIEVCCSKGYFLLVSLVLWNFGEFLVEIYIGKNEFILYSISWKTRFLWEIYLYSQNF